MRRFWPVAAAAAVLPLAGALAPQPAAADPGCTGPASGTRLYVRVLGVRSSAGLMAVTLYGDNPRKFLAKRGSLYVGRSPAHQGVTDTCIYVPKPGTYAVVVYHDADANRHFNRNFLGMPTEGAGASNNPNSFLGIPSFNAVRFAVRGDGQHISVKLRYP